ncbi:MAG TPA: hypothetical protein VLL98_01545 [Rickettsiales bacterium]|nr:hypothetical protein [Rickettsiales bacterium]
MTNCPYCGNEITYKNGKKYNKQRYLCPKCNKSFSLTDNRIKRDNRERELALLLYGRNSSMRSIQNIIEKFFDTKISIRLIEKWIKSFVKALQFDVNINKDKIQKEEKPKTIEILELDELYTWFYNIKKNEEKKSKYGLLLTETEIKLFHIK